MIPDHEEQPTPQLATEGPAEQPRAVSPFRLGSRGTEILPLALALALVIVIFQALSGFFLNPQNLANLLAQVAPLELIAVASTVMIVMGEIDLSLGSVAGFTGALGALLLANSDLPWLFLVALTFAAGVAVSAFHGLVVVVGRVRSFAVTLAGFFIWYGVQLAILGPNGEQVLRRAPIAGMASARIPLLDALVISGAGGALLILGWLFVRSRDRYANRLGWGELTIKLAAACAALGALLWFVTYLDGGGGLPLIFVLVLAVTAVMWIILTRTALGRHFYAVGGNLEAARQSGIRVQRVKWIGFAAAGALTTFAGFTIISYTGVADSSTGGGSLLLAGIGATVVGGVSLLGGRGSVWGAFGGAILLAVVQNGLNLLNLNFYAVDIVEGVVVLGALLADAALRERLLAR